jgi:hypothetical protein
MPNARRQFEPGFEARVRKFWTRRPRGKRDLDDGGVPVEPNRPRDLSGGAAAAVEFDD